MKMSKDTKDSITYSPLYTVMAPFIAAGATVGGTTAAVGTSAGSFPKRQVIQAQGEAVQFVAASTKAEKPSLDKYPGLKQAIQSIPAGTKVVTKEAGEIDFDSLSDLQKATLVAQLAEQFEKELNCKDCEKKDFLPESKLNTAGKAPKH